MTYRKKNRWLFGCSFGFCDNPKYLYLDVHHNRKDIESWWISKTVDEARRLRAKGINAVYVNSLHGYFLCLSAKVYIYSHHSCDINYFTSGNVIKVNLWHGVPVKEIEWGIKKNSASYKWFDGSIHSKFYYPFNYEKHDLVLIPGPFSLSDFKFMLRVDEAHSIKDAYPRCSIFKFNKRELEKLIKIDNDECIELYHKVINARKTYVYMPTFRDDERDFFQQSGIDITRLNTILRDRNDLMIIKFHPVTFSKLKEMPFLSNIHFVMTKLDIYPLLPLTDVLITDYSSIYFDYLLLKKGLVLFPFDYDQYVNSSRGFTHKYKDVFKGYTCMNSEQFMEIFIKDIDVRLNVDDYNSQISRFWYDNRNCLINTISLTVGC